MRVSVVTEPASFRENLRFLRANWDRELLAGLIRRAVSAGLFGLAVVNPGEFLMWQVRLLAVSFFAFVFFLVEARDRAHSELCDFRWTRRHEP